MRPQVAHRRLLAAAAAEQQPATEQDHADDGHHLDQREPELGLAEQLDVGQVDDVDRDEEQRRAGPGGHLRPPVVDVLADRGQLGHADQDVQHPAVPAGQEAGEAAPVFVREVAEGAGHRLLDDHLAELAHDQEGDEAGDGIAEDHRRPGRLEHPGRAEEQPGADGAAEGDQLDVAILEAALERARGLVVTHHCCVTCCCCL
ncbi:hypothetical protein D9M69_549650 [compost metagenome]